MRAGRKQYRRQLPRLWSAFLGPFSCAVPGKVAPDETSRTAHPQKDEVHAPAMQLKWQEWERIQLWSNKNVLSQHSKSLKCLFVLQSNNSNLLCYQSHHYEPLSRRYLFLPLSCDAIPHYNWGAIVYQHITIVYMYVSN